jgi:cytochrome b561
VLSAGLIAGGVRRDFPKSAVRGAGDYYLYLATAYGLWPTLLLVACLHFALSGGAWGLHSIPDATGPLFWMVFWFGFCILLVYYFGIVARYMYQALQIRPPANQWSTENRLLARLCLSFLVVFGVVEAGFLSLCLLLYVVTKGLV